MNRQTVLSTMSKGVAVMLISMLTLVGNAMAQGKKPLEVEVSNVSTYGSLKTKEFVGMIKIGGLIDISAPASGIVTEFKDALGKTVRAQERLAAIKNLDELYKDVVIKSPGNDIRIMRTYVEKGNFVEKHQLLMVLAKDIYYEANVHLVASEVEWLKNAKNIEVLVHPNTEHEQSFRIAKSRIEIPDQRKRFYNARLKLACPQERCEDVTLAGAIVKVVVKNSGNIQISKKALFNNDKTVAVINNQGIVEHRKVIKGRVIDDAVEVLHGLELGEQLVVNFNRPPVNGERAIVKATVVNGLVSVEPDTAFE